MADTAARLAICARRNEVARFTIAVTGIDLTGVAMAMQIRLGRDVPGAPLISLATVTTASAEGLKLDSVTTTAGMPTSIIKGRINASTMTDATKVPYTGEVGDNTVLAYAMQWTLAGDAQTRLYGDFVVIASAFGSDSAPTNRPASYGSPSAGCGSATSGSLTFGDQIIQVSIGDAVTIGLLLAQGDKYATLAGHYANDNTDTDVPGGAVGSRGAKWWNSLVQATKTAIDGIAAAINAKLVTISDRSGYVGGFQSASGLLGVGFRGTDMRAIFGNGGDIVSRIEAGEAIFSRTVTGRSGIDGGYIFPNGQMAWHVDVWGRFFQNGRYIPGEVDVLKTRLIAVESGTTVPAGTRDLVLIGDSMSAPGSGIADTMPAKVPDRAVYVSAEGGEQTAGIAVSFGVPDLLTLAISGNVIPTTGTVTFVPNINFMNTGTCARVEVCDETGSPVLCYAYNAGGTYSLRPAVYPAAALKVQNPARTRVVSLQAQGTDPSGATALSLLYPKTGVIRPARNDIGSDRSYSGSTVVSLVQRIAALFTSGRYIVLGPTNGPSDVPTSAGGSNSGVSAANAQITLDNCIDLNSRLAAAFTDRYRSVIGNFKALGSTTVFTVNGSAYTVVSSSVLIDDLHENTTGKNNTSDLVVTALAAKGY